MICRSTNSSIRPPRLVVDFVNWFGPAVSEHMAGELAVTAALRNSAQQLAGGVQLQVRYFGRSMSPPTKPGPGS